MRTIFRWPRKPWWVAGVWMTAWLAYPDLPRYLPFPVPWPHPLLWRTTWALIALPSVTTLIVTAAGHGSPIRQRDTSLLTGTLLIAAQLAYFWWRVPPIRHPVLLMRWIAGGVALVTLMLLGRRVEHSLTPLLGVLSAAAIVFTFMAPPLWAVIFAGATLGSTAIWMATGAQSS